MSDTEEQTGGDGESEKEFAVEIAKQGRAACKKCKEKCPKDEMRIAKLVHNPFGDGKMKSWYHTECLFEAFLKQRPTTKRIECTEDIEGFGSLPNNEQQKLTKRIEKSNIEIREKYGMKAAETPKKKTPKKSPVKNNNNTTTTIERDAPNNEVILSKRVTTPYPFKDFRRLVADITNVNGYLEKTQIVSDFLKKGKDGVNFEGDIYLWCKLLLPGVFKRIYNLQSKQLIKLFSKLLNTNHSKMLEHLEQGDIGETIQKFYEESLIIKPAKKSNLTVEEVEEFLEELSQLTKEEEQIAHFQSMLRKCTSNDLKIIIRLIKHDLRMNAGAKHVLDGVHPDAYEAYQSSKDLKKVINKCLCNEGKPLNSSKGVTAKVSVMTPVLPMLAEACKSVEMAMKKCPNGMYSEIKYDGERVQVHKKGSEFKYFSRSLKPVLNHKIAHFKDHIPLAFPTGDDLILDSEILMIDKETQAPLPFGSLGKHKKNEYENACVCLFVFDCIYFNGEDLSKKPIQYRKKILSENMNEVKNHVVFSESEIIHKPSDLRDMMVKVFKLGLEGLVLKDLQSNYEPGKRHWLKVKKDYLFDGAMADSADLIVLGAWYGTGKKGGKMSVFLMGCYDDKKRKFCTVTKVHTGLDDKTLDELQDQLRMVKISSNPNKIPDWLSCNRPMVPDFVAEDPKNQPVWEITGAEFTQHEVHTAEGISIRFPRITKIRHDKTWETATSLKELKILYENSKEHTDVSLLLKDGREDNKPSTSSKDAERIIENKRKRGSDTSPKKKKKIEETEVPTSHSIGIKKYESDLFEGVKLFLEEGVQNLMGNWCEKFTSNSGMLLKTKNIEEATHVLHLNKFVKDIKRDYPRTARHVIFDWVRDSIEYKCLQDFQLYTVKWRPDL